MALTSLATLDPIVPWLSFGLAILFDAGFVGALSRQGPIKAKRGTAILPRSLLQSVGLQVCNENPEHPRHKATQSLAHRIQSEKIRQLQSVARMPRVYSTVIHLGHLEPI